MDKLDFDKKVKEMIDGFTEKPELGSWELIASELERRRSLRRLRMRRNIYAYSAVAAALLLLFFALNPDIRSGGEQRDGEVAVVERLSEPVPSDNGRVLSEDNSGGEDKSFSGESSLSARALVAVVPERRNPESGVAQSAEYFAEQESIDRGALVVSAVESVTEAVERQEAGVVERVTEAAEGQEAIEVERVTEAAEGQGKAVVPAGRSDELTGRYIFEYPRESTRTVRRKPLIAVATNMSLPSPAGIYHPPYLPLSSSSQPSDFQSSLQPVGSKTNLRYGKTYNDKHYMPVTAGAQIIFPISKAISIGTGLNYTLLMSDFDVKSNGGTTQEQFIIHYLGVPLNLQYGLYSNKSMRLYAAAGGGVEKGLRMLRKVKENGVPRKTEYYSVEGVQLSVNFGLGAEIKASESIGFYFDPNFTYYFDNGQPAPTIRTAQPLMFRFELGLRFHL